MSIALNRCDLHTTATDDGGGDADDNNKRSSDEIRWTDDKIRWSDDEDADDDDGGTRATKKDTTPDEDDEAALKDPFKEQDSTELFTRTFTLPAANPYHKNSDDDGTKNGNATKATTTIELQGYQAEADEIWKSTGLTLWRASDYLCEYLLEQPQLLLRRRNNNDNNDNNRNVLELGAGLGLVGLLAHRILASLTDRTAGNNTSRVVLTDGDTDTLAQLRANLKRNQEYNNQQQHRIECRQLLWGRETATKFRNATTSTTVTNTFDVILASDIVYAAGIVEPLWETIEVLLSKPITTGGRTTDDVETTTSIADITAPCFVLAFAKRRVPVTIDTVLEAAAAHGFSHELVKEDPTGIWVYVFQWRQT